MTVLPLKPVLRGKAGEALRRRFEAIQPTLLLFLQRLRRISVVVDPVGRPSDERRKEEAEEEKIMVSIIGAVRSPGPETITAFSSPSDRTIRWPRFYSTLLLEKPQLE